MYNIFEIDINIKKSFKLLYNILSSFTLYLFIISICTCTRSKNVNK